MVSPESPRATLCQRAGRFWLAPDRWGLLLSIVRRAQRRAGAGGVAEVDVHREHVAALGRHAAAHLGPRDPGLELVAAVTRPAPRRRSRASRVPVAKTTLPCALRPTVLTSAAARPVGVVPHSEDHVEVLSRRATARCEPASGRPGRSRRRRRRRSTTAARVPGSGVTTGSTTTACRYNASLSHSACHVAVSPARRCRRAEHRGIRVVLGDRPSSRRRIPSIVGATGAQPIVTSVAGGVVALVPQAAAHERLGLLEQGGQHPPGEPSAGEDGDEQPTRTHVATTLPRLAPTPPLGWGRTGRGRRVAGGRLVRHHGFVLRTGPAHRPRPRGRSSGLAGPAGRRLGPAAGPAA